MEMRLTLEKVQQICKSAHPDMIIALECILECCGANHVLQIDNSSHSINDLNKENLNLTKILRDIDDVITPCLNDNVKVDSEMQDMVIGNDQVENIFNLLRQEVVIWL
jgi:hypothetical protein